MKDLKNTYRPKRQQQSYFSELVSGKFLEKGLFELLPFSLYVCALLVFYINNSYKSESYIRTISSLERELKDLRAEYITTKSQLMFQSKQTQVQSLVQSQGLAMSNEQPIVIRIDQ
ncbi:MAG: FtsL-like putative cell division protein [Bacteroidota bacterium]|nr:FtsL-like putative cell division protein [Bacteroidota bacterium]